MRRAQEGKAFDHGNGEPAFDQRFDQGKFDQTLWVLLLEGAEVAVEGGGFVACEQVAIDDVFDTLMANALL